MWENSENLCKFDMVKFAPIEEWKDDIYLADGCRERFLTQSDFPEFENNHIFMAGLTVLEEGYHVERINSNLHNFLFTLEGYGVLTTEQGVQIIEPNTVTILPAGYPFRFELYDGDIGWKMSWILLDDHPKWASLATGNPRVESWSACEQSWSLLQLLHNEIGGRTSYRTLLISELTRILLGGLSKDTPSTTELRVQSLFNVVETQLHQPWTVKGMAERCFITVEQLNRVCKKLYGSTTQQKLISLRMEKALDLLHYQDWSIAMVAQRLGYPDPFNFTHRFRRFHGCSPSEYRKTIRNKE
ncbi:AraC family transcriptional regulator [Vibrio sp. SCSIO 43136]|uniref:AraC family transcriptional regulator n=1 Tax=Vibrio sp. SCSIO 43136 TaxID=2819101 RepID=UPI00207516DC|nr:AraC family transcriptional regulator [Vibrio sp. SCSIO 43136]USD67653.1 helix-turn-helix transcriptional regulator [Vibrio sp. SCSIO 43136]